MEMIGIATSANGRPPAFPVATGPLSKGRPGSVCGGIGAMDGVRLAYTDVLAATPQTGTGRPKPGNALHLRLFA